MVTRQSPARPARRTELGGIKLGVLGGSFNPVHLGHLHIARRSREMFGLSEVHFVVASVPPHKAPGDLIPFAHRYAMVSLATSGCPGFLPSLAETEPPVSPYTVDTLAKVARACGLPGCNLYFIGGGDSLQDVAGWHDSVGLLESYNFIFVMRPGVLVPAAREVLPPAAAGRVVDARGIDPVQVQSRLAGECGSKDCRIYLIDVGAPDIAASRIRKMASRGEAIGPVVPAAVQEYITKLRLYGE